MVNTSFGIVITANYTNGYSNNPLCVAKLRNFHKAIRSNAIILIMICKLSIDFLPSTVKTRRSVNTVLL